MSSQTSILMPVFINGDANGVTQDYHNVIIQMNACQLLDPEVIEWYLSDPVLSAQLEASIPVLLRKVFSLQAVPNSTNVLKYLLFIWKYDMKKLISYLVSFPMHCIKVHDNPQFHVFHGCVDWHSAVEALWAITAYMDNITLPDLSTERKYLLTHPGFEMHYGRSWFLRFAVERIKKNLVSNELTLMANDVADSLVMYIRKSTDTYLGDYNCVSWALVNLFHYSRISQRKDIEDFIHAVVQKLYIPRIGRWQANGDFLDAQLTNYLLLALTGYPILSMIPHYKPIKPKNTHQYGLNFSRAWCYYQLLRCTGCNEFLDLYIDHLDSALRDIQNTHLDYRTLGHWIPQFALLALHPLAY